MFLIFDTETTGLPQRYDAPLTDFDNWPRMIQLAWQLHDEMGHLIEVQNFIIRPEGFVIPRGSEKIHGISTERALEEGFPLIEVLSMFNKSIEKADVVSGHNIEFDNSIVGAEMLRMNLETTLFDKTIVDTKESSTNYCALPGGRGGKYKWPTLGELHLKLFNESFGAAHNASADVQATARCFFELIRLGIITPAILKMDSDFIHQFIEASDGVVQSVGFEYDSYHEEEPDEPEDFFIKPGIVSDRDTEAPFTHLHVHTQYSVLDGLTDIGGMVKKAKEDGMTALAITDHGYMYGAKKFHLMATMAGLKPIIGCETYVARRGMHLKEIKTDGKGWHLVLLAKNLIGYNNLMKLVSAAATEGFYYRPRVDKALLKEHHEGLIALTACLGGEIADKIVHQGEEKAEEALLEYKEIFGDDLYLEIMRHPTGDPEMDKKVFDDQQYVIKVMKSLALKHQVKLVATNDVHFLNSDDAAAHDQLICIGTAKDLDDPKRFRYTRQEWFKTRSEMAALFSDLPEALDNTHEVANKIEVYELDKSPIMPEFTIPETFSDANDYLRHISYEGAQWRYGEISAEIAERIEFELGTIKFMGFPDYFLIVWDFLKAAREMGVSVGPGRGSAAGSVVSYCLRITDIEPLKYNLLFERFLNPDRISMPDIDIDFDDDGRDKVLHWVREKYGTKRVAHLITFGTMAAKMAIRDVARVQKLPLSEADRLSKLIPEVPGITLAEALKQVPELKFELDKGKPEVSSVILNAIKLEGSVRNTGTHACGIIIGREDLDHYIPVTTVKDSVLEYASQYDGKFIEPVGLLKMDFLGLKTLSIIKDTLKNIKKSKEIDLDIDAISFEDEKTYKLFSRGDTVALFQFESDGMRKHLKNLKPSRFEDLIAMVALYRPGPMEYIPNFIDRKNEREKIEYDVPEMAEYLEETYGITVYQEQVMLLSRKLGGFTRGESDSLRKAMGKKKIDEMEKLKALFLEGCKANNLPLEKVEKVWKDWEAFAKYAFNKSHATCYAYLAYQTAFLKANYRAEFMAANLSRNLNDIKKITHLISETKRMGIDVLRPDVNESSIDFTVTKDGIIRFGLGAIKGVGTTAAEQMIEEREKNGPFTNVFDFAKRVNLKSVNKRSLEALAKAGAFDAFEGTHRAQYFFQENENSGVFIEKITRHGATFQEQRQSLQVNLFGDMDDLSIKDPELPVCEHWTVPQQLFFEKEVTGFYISGHPLDPFAMTIKRFCNITIDELRNNMVNLKGHQVTFAGLITSVTQRTSKKGSLYGQFTIEDFSGDLSLTLFSEDYLKRKHLLDVGNNVFITAKVEERNHQPGMIEVRLSDMTLLTDVMAKLAESITVFLPAKEVSDESIKQLLGIAAENKGGCALKIGLDEEEENIHLILKSGTVKIDPEAFVTALSEEGSFSFSIQ